MKVKKNLINTYKSCNSKPIKLILKNHGLKPISNDITSFELHLIIFPNHTGFNAFD